MQTVQPPGDILGWEHQNIGIFHRAERVTLFNDLRNHSGISLHFTIIDEIRAALTDKFVGPVAVAFGFGEAPDTARAITEYIKASKSILTIKGGFFGNVVIDAAGVEKLARLPSKEVLISQVLGGLQAPLYGLVNVLAGPVRGLAYVLQARIKQLEGAS